MKIVVLVKEVPDTWGNRVLNTETGLADREANERVLDEIAERSVEVAISYAQAHPGTEVVAISMGPKEIVASLRRALALGVDSAVHVLDENLIGADLGLTAEVLAAAIQRVGFDIVIAGNQSTDGAGGVIPAMVAEILGVPQATGLHTVEIADDHVAGARITEYGVAQVRASLPAVVSITEALPDARVPNFKGIVAAKKKPIETLLTAELGISPDYAQVPRSIMVAVSERPPRPAGLKLIDDGNAGVDLADFLVQNRLV